MADEIKKVISIDVTQAVASLNSVKQGTDESTQSFQSLGEAKKYIDKLKASLIDLNEGSEEYNQKCEEIAETQQKVNAAMKAGSTTSKDAEGSYNALSKQMAELKKAFKSTNDEAERDKLAKQIVGVNDKLKEMDASIGNYQRNVGNYEGAFTKGLTGIADKITSLGNPLAIAKKAVGSLGTAFKALIANPIGAVIAAIVVAVKALKKGFEGSEEASNKLKKAFSALEPITNAISNVLTKAANIIGDLAEKVIPKLVSGVQKAGLKIAELLNKLGIVSDEKLQAFKDNIEAQKEAVATTQALTDREIALTEKKRKAQVQDAKLELEISQLKAKAADKEKYSAEQRQKYLEAAIAKERALNKSRLDIAQEEFDILKEKSKLTDNNAETNDELAAAEANLYKVKKEYFDKEKELTAQLNEAKKAGADVDKKAAEDAKKAAAEALKQREKDLEKIKEIQQKASDNLLSSGERDIAILKRTYEEEKALLEKYGEDTTNLTAAYEKKKAEIKAGQGDKKLTNIDEEAALQQYIADKTIQIEYEKNRKLLEIDAERLTQRKAALEELLQIDNLSVEKKEEYAEALAKVNADINENARQSKVAEQEHAKEIVATYSDLAVSLGSLMDNIAEIWQDNIKQRYENGEITKEQAEEEFENTKKMQIAAAIVNGLAGVATAVATAMSLGPILGPIMAGINSALVITTTALQISKIKQTKFDSGSGSSVSNSGVTPSSSATAYTPSYSTNVTGQSETTDLANAISEGQADTKVYVVESDIQKVGKKVEVRESESTF